MGQQSRKEKQEEQKKEKKRKKKDMNSEKEFKVEAEKNLRSFFSTYFLDCFWCKSLQRGKASNGWTFLVFRFCRVARKLKQTTQKKAVTRCSCTLTLGFWLRGLAANVIFFPRTGEETTHGRSHWKMQTWVLGRREQ